MTPTKGSRAAFVSTGLGLLALAPALPASATESRAAVRWAPSTARTGASDDGHLTGTVRLVADVSIDRPADGWSLTVLTDALQPAFGVVCEQAFSRPKDSFRINCPWDTSRYPDGRPSPNQRYVARVATRHGEAFEPIGPDRPVALANPAAVPDDLAVAFDHRTATVAMTWRANAEPDLTHYDVEENIAGRGWARIGEPTETSFRRRVAEAGEHEYRVAAERNTPDGERSGPGPWARPNRSSDRVRLSSETTPPPTNPGPERGKAGDDTSRQPPPGRPRHGDTRPASTPATAPPGSTEPGAAPPPEPVRATAPDPSPGPDPGTAPADHASVTFSASSARALAALHDQPAPIAPTPAPRIGADVAPAGPDPDTGFQTELPYAAADRQTGSPPSSPSPGADDEVASPPDPTSGRRRRDHRPEGVGLLVVAAGLLAAALRPVPLLRSPRARSGRGAQAARITALEQRLAHLEHLLASN